MDDQPSELDQRQTSPAVPVVLTPVPIVQGQGQKQVVVLTPQSATGRKRRRLLMLGGLGILLVLGVGLWYWSNGTVTHLYKTLPVDRGPITSLITATGAVNPVISVQVGSQVSGKIARIYADFNSVVREGQVLASIDQKPYQAKVSQAKAALKSALANLAKARNMVAQRKLELDRIATLRAQQFVAQSDLDLARTSHRDAEAQVDLTQAQVDQAKATLASAELDLGYTTIISPVNGTVVSRIVVVACPPPRVSRYDFDNLAKRLKPAFDALADALGVDDGEWRAMVLERGERCKAGAVIVEVEIHGGDDV